MGAGAGLEDSWALSEGLAAAGTGFPPLVRGHAYPTLGSQA